MDAPQAGQHETGQHETGQHETGQHETGQHETGQHHTGQHQTGQHETGEAYTGPAEVLEAGGATAISVQVQLRGHFQPIDGRFHWYGRIDASEDLVARHRSGATVALRTPHGVAAGKVADVDPWGRFRITGLGAPPF
ncbi:MAG: DUF4873 domain-containing protein [Propionibacteriales bacterium]|nr:DUF4873 domain-containing protein [Propionibacteriales bacterium]